jgi:hypothetical protein
MARTPAVGLSSATVSTASNHGVTLDLICSIAVTNRLKIQEFWDAELCVLFGSNSGLPILKMEVMWPVETTVSIYPIRPR